MNPTDAEVWEFIQTGGFLACLVSHIRDCCNGSNCWISSFHVTSSRSFDIRIGSKYLVLPNYGYMTFRKDDQLVRWNYPAEHPRRSSYDLAKESDTVKLFDDIRNYMFFGR